MGLYCACAESISETQSGFQNGIKSNGFDFSTLFNEGGCILFLDFSTFLKRNFILQTLNNFGFGHKFIDVIVMLYSDMDSWVALGQGTCLRFKIKRGIR